MSYFALGPPSDLVQSSDIVVEGQIEFVLLGQIPGSEGRVFGQFCIFAPGFRRIHASAIGQQILDLNQSLGFWVDRKTKVATGDRLRAHLVQSSNRDNCILLTPNGITADSVEFLDSGVRRPFHDEPIPTTFMPVKYGIYTSIRTPGRMFDYLNDIKTAVNMWKAHLPSYVTFEVFAYSLNFAPPPPRHFDVEFGPTGAGRIGVTQYVLPRKPANDLGNVGFIRIRPRVIINGQEYSWSAPGSRASQNQLDFISNCAHEIGHSLGLDHLSDPNDVMYPSLTVGQVRSTLSANDIAAIQSLYP